MKRIESLINFNLKQLEKPYEKAVSGMLDFNDSSVRIAVLEYGIKGCGKRYPREKVYLEEIDFFSVAGFEDLFYFEKLLIFWHREGMVTDIEIYDIRNDLHALKDDYDIIVEKIANGSAHLLSEGDTVLLGAGLAGGKCKAPDSDRTARCRAFVLKKRYLQKIIDELGYRCRI